MKQFWLIWLLLLCFTASSQDEMEKKKTLTWSGYVKDLLWASLHKDFKNTYATNLIHNRLNFKWNPSEKFSGRLEIRNRFYWGDDVKRIPDFKEELRNQNEFVDLSKSWISTGSTVLHSNIERLWMEYREEKWNIRAGRQRINWGIANTWNPNDIFNAYNFLDFDYEERPGSDAVKFQYILTDLANIEFAFAGTGDEPIPAIKYSTNYREYDIQGIMGLYQNTITAGVGWAGSISDIGFKGEAQYYGGRKDSVSHFNLTMEGDYMFESGWYLSSAILFNGGGWTKPLENGMNINFEVSPQNLMPAKWNFLVNTFKEFTPLFNGSLSVVYSPGLNMLILFPSFKYSLKTNLDLDLVWQSYFAELEKFQGISHTGFLRIRWSF